MIYNKTLHKNNTINIDNYFIEEPPCSIFITEGVVTEILCPKDEDNPNKTTLAIPQQDLLFTTLRYLLPRLQSTLFNTEIGINELESFGNVKMKRNYTTNQTDENGNNCTSVTNEYKLSDFDTYYDQKPKDRKIGYDTMINQDTNDVEYVQFRNTFIMVDLAQILVWNSFRYTLRLIDSYPLTKSELDEVRDEIYIESPINDYTLITYSFTFDEWRGISADQNKTEKTGKFILK